MKRLILPLLLAACERSAAETATTPAATSAAGVEVVRVTARRLETTTRLPGELMAFETVAIYPRVAGFLEEIPVDRGSRVKRGDLLARLSAPELSAHRAEAESKAQAARSTYESLKAAAKTPGAVAGHDVDVAEDALKAEEAHVTSLKTLENYLSVRAPFEGVVTERNVHPGALLGPPASPNASPIVRIDQIARLRLTVAVPESDVGAVAEGATTSFTVRAWPGRKFSGAVRRVARSLDVKTRSMPVELDVENTDEVLAPGMYADVSWPVRRTGPTMFVPQTCVVRTTEKTFVDRVVSGAVEQVVVQPGASDRDEVEVFGDLKEGDLLLKRGSEELPNGAHVSVRTPGS